MLEIILNRIQPQAVEIIAEKHLGFVAGRKTRKAKVLISDYLQAITVTPVDFKKTFDMVWHEALRVTITKYNINVIIENLYDKAQGAHLLNGSTWALFRTTV